MRRSVGGGGGSTHIERVLTGKPSQKTFIPEFKDYHGHYMVVVMGREFDCYGRIIVSAPCLLIEHPRALLLIAVTSLGNKNFISSMILR